MPAQSPIEDVRYFNHEYSHQEKPELHYEELFYPTSLKNAVHTYGYINMFHPYGKNFIVLTGVDVYNLWKSLG